MSFSNSHIQIFRAAGTLLLMLVCAPLYIQAQGVELDRQVIGSAGNHSEDTTANFTLSSTTGETAVQTLISGQVNTDLILTQGFQQPDQTKLYDSIFFDIAIKNELCVGAIDGALNVQNLMGCIGPYRITWSTGDSSTILDNLSTGAYTITITSADGCEVTRTVTVPVDNELPCDVRVFSGITPNGDGFNDQWLIENIDLHMPNEMTIFNRYGSVVWNGKNYDNSSVVFEGNLNNGNQLPNGTYFYLLEIGDIKNKGWIEITR